MNVFIGIAAFMTLLVVAWMAYPLLRPKNASGISSERINIDIHRDQLKALEADLTRGVISQQDFEATRDELQLRLLDDTESYEPGMSKAGHSFWTARRTSIAISITIPVVAMAMYMQLGSPQAINPVAAVKGQNLEMEQMIVKLAAKLKSEPNNPEGWAMLARSYKMMGRIEEAHQAFVNAGELVYKHPDLMVEYADVLAVIANSLEGKPLELVNKALAMNPLHPLGLMISAEAAFRRSDYKLAIKQWETVLTQLEPNSPDAQQITSNIADARAKAGLPATQNTLSEAGKLPPVPAGAAAGMTPDMINQMVERLANRLKANPDDPAGWEQLARAYTVLGRNDDAQKAQANAKLASTKKP